MITFANVDDYISFRHHTYDQQGKRVELTEVGPRFEMKLYQQNFVDHQIHLVMLAAKNGKPEWVYGRYKEQVKAYFKGLEDK